MKIIYFLLLAVGATAIYSPLDLSDLYQIPEQQQYIPTIAIIIPIGSETLLQDCADFSSFYGLPTPNIEILPPVGWAHMPTHQDKWAQEATLDVQWAHAGSPLSPIKVFVSASDQIQDIIITLQFLNRYHHEVGTIHAVSMSWGVPSFREQVTFDYLFQDPTILFFASSGDRHAECNWPASSSRVVAVGGTVFQDGVEVAWEDSGGGVCPFVQRPHYQEGFQKSAFRTVPDVSILGGEAVWIMYQGEWIPIMGTSLSSPLFAALYATATATVATHIHETIYSRNGLFRSIVDPRSEEYCMDSLIDPKEYNCRAGVGSIGG